MNIMLVNWNLLVAAVKLVNFERVTCSFVGVTCSIVGVTCSFDVTYLMHKSLSGPCILGNGNLFIVIGHSSRRVTNNNA